MREKQKKQKRLRELCKQAHREEDQEKLRALMDQILQLLAECQVDVEIVDLDLRACSPLSYL
jgi:hypothetical protein